MAGPLRNLRWERFAREYASGESQTSAYIRAGFADTPNARFNASRLANKEPVRARVNELMEQFAEAAVVKVEYLQNPLLPTLRTNPQDLFDEDGRLKPIRNLPREVAATIKTIKFDRKTGNVAEIVLADKVAAAGTLLRSVGAVANSNVNNGVKIGLGERVDRVIQRLSHEDVEILLEAIQALPSDAAQSTDERALEPPAASLDRPTRL